MANELAKTQLPFINQSIARQLRSGAFRSKNQVGPQTAQAITQGSLESERATAMDQAAQASKLKQTKQLHDQDLLQQKDQMAQNQLQFESHQAAQAKLQADQLAAQAKANEDALAAQAARDAQDQANFEAAQAQAASDAYEARKAQEEADEGIFGSF